MRKLVVDQGVRPSFKYHAGVNEVSAALDENIRILEDVLLLSHNA